MSGDGIGRAPAPIQAVAAEARDAELAIEPQMLCKLAANVAHDGIARGSAGIASATARRREQLLDAIEDHRRQSLLSCSGARLRRRRRCNTAALVSASKPASVARRRWRRSDRPAWPRASARARARDRRSRRRSRPARRAAAAAARPSSARMSGVRRTSGSAGRRSSRSCAGRAPPPACSRPRRPP